MALRASHVRASLPALALSHEYPSLMNHDADVGWQFPVSMDI
jgi:hypothetical protein